MEEYANNRAIRNASTTPSGLTTTFSNANSRPSSHTNEGWKSTRPAEETTRKTETVL